MLAELRPLLILGGLVALGLALLYLLRPRRRRVEVPFGGLWQKVLAEAEARAVGRNWRRLLSFLLMLGLALVMLWALAEPVLERKLTAERATRPQPHTVLIVDVSASMATRDGRLPTGPQPREGARRLDEAVAELERRVTAAPRGERFLLLAAAGHVEVRAGWGADRQALLQALRTLQPSDAGLDLRRALQTARDALSGRAEPRIVLASDGGPPLAAVAPALRTDLVHLTVGPGRAGTTVQGPVLLDDLAVEQVRIRPAAADPGRGTLTVRLRNDSGREVAARLEIAASASAQTPAELARPEALRRVHEVELPPGTSSHAVADLDLISPRFAVRVRPRDDAFRDRAPWNDLGLAVLAERRKLHVLAVTPGNRFLEAAVLANDRLELKTLAPDQYRPADFTAATRGRHGIDVVVLDQVEAPLPEGTPGLVLSLAGPAGQPPPKLAQGAEIAIRAADHPLMRGASFQDTNFDQVRLLQPQPGDTVLAVARPDRPVMLAREAGVRHVEWGISLFETDLGLRFAMPLLVGNAVAWLAGEDEPLLAPLELGRAWAVQAPATAVRWRYLEPGRPPRPARTAGAQLLASSEIHGIHAWRAADGREVARPTVLPASENPTSRTAPGPTWQPRPVGTGPETELDRSPRWSWLLLLAGAGLGLEWLLYLRRRTV